MKNNKKRIKVPRRGIVTVMIIACIFSVCKTMPFVVQAKSLSSVYTITTTSKPCDKSANYTTYNKYTRYYYTITSYLKKLENTGGGTLILEKGVYKITNTLYIPANVTIKLKDGVKIVKGTKTGTSKFGASHSIFQMCSNSNSVKKGAYRKYNGESNIAIVGEGKAEIDLNYDVDTVGIMMCHNSSITISNIIFSNMYSGHFIELDASKDVTITKCTFQNHKDSPNNNKEAINLDTPDKVTNGFHAEWSSYDKTPNKNITISDCTFEDLERAIGTHKYSENKLHENVQILNNVISNCDQDAIRVMNWEKPVIKGNIISNVADKKAGMRAILMSGVIDPQISENVFKKVSRPIQIIPWKNDGDGSEYDIIYSVISTECIELMKNNVLEECDENFIRYNKTYNEYKENTEKIPVGIN
ncbi:MAG: right-handed parallel beta-helix repeat-containing protein [Herbinix sp.]|nr:right-handed parallel beta-helix repeat-containing protein [Herbinix sp.]